MVLNLGYVADSIKNVYVGKRYTLYHRLTLTNKYVAYINFMYHMLCVEKCMSIFEGLKISQIAFNQWSAIAEFKKTPIKISDSY